MCSKVLLVLLYRHFLIFNCLLHYFDLQTHTDAHTRKYRHARTKAYEYNSACKCVYIPFAISYNSLFTSFVSIVVQLKIDFVSHDRCTVFSSCGQNYIDPFSPLLPRGLTFSIELYHLICNGAKKKIN